MSRLDARGQESSLYGSASTSFGFGALGCGLALHAREGCNCAAQGGAATQQLEELEFLKGACAAAQAGDMHRLTALLDRNPRAVFAPGEPGVGPGPDSSSTLTQGSGDGYTPLHYAARAGRLAAARLLLERGALVDALTRQGRAAPLHRAAAQGHTEVVALLLERGAQAGRADADGETPLHKAAAGGHEAACRLLLAAAPGAAAALDRRGLTPAQRCPPGSAAARLLAPDRQSDS